MLRLLIWPPWCRAAEHALGLPVGGTGSLLLARRRRVLPAPDEEAVEAAKQQATVTNLRSQETLAAAKNKALQDWAAAQSLRLPAAARRGRSRGRLTYPRCGSKLPNESTTGSVAPLWCGILRSKAPTASALRAYS
eukprot:6483355-Amphidinium_carterae.1